MILIDMHMPKNCIECPIHDGEYGWCDLDADIAMNCDDRPDNCPLHEVTADPDTINRKQAIDAMGRATWAINRINELPSAQSEPQKTGRWIPVTEILPKEKMNNIVNDFESVLCSTTFGDVRMYTYGKPIGWREPHFWNGPGIMDEYVIAWMPKPETYKGVDA